MEKLMKDLEQAKKECSFSLSFIAPYRRKDGTYNWDQESVFEKETLTNRFYDYQDLKSKIEKIQKEIEDKKYRIDNFAMSVIPSAMNLAYEQGKDLSYGNIAVMSYNYAEAMETERERRINTLNK